MNKYYCGLLFFMLFSLVACQEEEIDNELIQAENIVKETTVNSCSYMYEEYYDNELEIQNLTLQNGTVMGNVDNFLSPCKEENTNPIIFANNSVRSYRIELELEHIYPIKEIEIQSIDTDNMKIEDIGIYISLDGVRYEEVKTNISITNNNVISMENNLAKFIRISFENKESQRFYGLTDLDVVLGDGYMIKEDNEWTSAFLRYDGWTGADGIFSFNLTNGEDAIGSIANTTGFIFSDTFIGTVIEESGARMASSMINNTFGYLLDEQQIKENLLFEWGGEDVPESLFLPSEFIGYHQSNIANNIGFDVYNSTDALLTNEGNGTMWLSEETDNEFLVFDLQNTSTVSDLYFWNYNDETKFGVKDFELYISDDLDAYEYYDTFTLPQASGEEGEPYSIHLNELNISARYLKIKLISNYELEPTHFGLGKILIMNQNDIIYPQVVASTTVSTIEGNEESSRLWIQDGVVIDNHLYLFPLLIKDFQGFFDVFKVGIIDIPIVDERLDYSNMVYYDSNLQSKTADQEKILYGAGVFNNTVESGNKNADGFIYIYGYIDKKGSGLITERKLIVARCHKEDITNTNEWTYYNGTSFVSEINESYGLIDGVSPELSVTYIEDGINEGKYMLTVMKNSTSGVIAYSISDTPYGRFEDYNIIYNVKDDKRFVGEFAYNAKMHAHLSEPGNYLISYNVNTTAFFELNNANIYYPRFIRLIEVQHKSE